MAWTPTSTLLLTTDEFKNFSKSISYTDALGVVEPVTITAVNANDTVTVLSNTISGYFSESFLDTQIQYRTFNDTFIDVPKFTDINIAELDELIHFNPDPTLSETYSYLATSTTSSQTYTIVVTNNWSVGRDTLLRYIAANIEANSGIAITWNNTSSNIVGWTNSSEQTLNWTNIV